MKKALRLYFCLCLLFSTTKLSAENSLIDSPTYEENYSWKTTDSAQKKQAVGMTITGFVLFIGIGLLSGFVPTCIGSTTTTPLGNDSTETTNTILGSGS